MSESPITEAHKRALIVAYYLSRFDRKGVRALGYATAIEAFEENGFANERGKEFKEFILKLDAPGTDASS